MKFYYLTPFFLIAFIVTLCAQNFNKITVSPVVTDGGISGGVSWADYDNDGDLDLFITNAQNQVNFLYRNDGTGNFTKIDDGAIVTDINRSAGNSWGDYDNDGDLDLFISNQQQNDILYQNEGNGNFSKITSGVITSNPGDSHHCSWVDYNNDGLLDLFVANGGFTTAQNNFLYLNNGDSTFTQITTGSIVTDNHDTFGGNWADYDDDGDLDLFVAHFNNGNNLLYRNDGSGDFLGIHAGILVNDGGSSIGSSWADYDNDGDLDLFVANWNNQNNCLYRNDGNGDFTKITSGAIVSDGGVSWVAAWGDCDNDGDLDLFVTNYNQNNFLYLNNGNGEFTKEVQSVVVNDGGLSSGACWGDYDNDGDLDLVVANWENQNNYLYENLGNSNNWINIKCIGTISNSSAIGTRVRIKTIINGNPIWQMREISANTGLRSQNSLNVEFGLGDASTVDSIIIEWPSGIEESYLNLEVKQFINITENTGISSVERTEELPAKIRLNHNYPNPFNPETTIEYNLPNSTSVKLFVYNIEGQKIKTLVDGWKSNGIHKVRWNGTNDTGQTVSSGIFLYRLYADNIVKTNKMVLLK